MSQEELDERELVDLEKERLEDERFATKAEIEQIRDYERSVL